MLAARDLVRDAGGFDPRLACNADWDMYIRLAQHSPVAPVDRPLVAYRVHPRAMSRDVPGCDEDFALMLRKYAALRSAAGVEVDRSTWAGWRANMYLRTGRRWRSLRALSGTDHLGRVVQSVIVTGLPGAVRLRDYRQARRVPTAWRAAAEAWLAQLGG